MQILVNLKVSLENIDFERDPDREGEGNNCNVKYIM